MDKKVRNSGNLLWELELMCVESKSTSLIMGFPDYNPPENLLGYVRDVASGKDVFVNQYCPRGNGKLSLLEAFADLYSPILNRTLDPTKNIAVDVGATGVLVKLFKTFTSPGAEVIMFEPYFCPYKAYATETGAVPVFVPLRLTPPADGSPPTSADFIFDPQELEAAFSDKTSLLVLNSPQNPTGKMFTQEEMEFIANLCIKHDVICISDEVYEMFTYSDTKHIKMANLPGMWERTVTVGSAGKLFGMTAWAAGFLVGHEKLISQYMQRILYPLNTALMEVYARAYRHELDRLNQPDCFFNTLPKTGKVKLDRITKIMADLGLDPIAPQGGYFIFCDVSKVDDQYCQGENDKATNFAFWLAKNKGLGITPANVFYSPEGQHLGANFVRICFLKSENTITAAENCLKGLRVTSDMDSVSNGFGETVNGFNNGFTNGHEK